MAKKILVESEVRSPRLKVINKGFKASLACNSSPLDLPLKMIKNLGANYCQIDDDLLSEKALSTRKKKISKTVEKKKMKENKTPANNEAVQDLQDKDDVVLAPLEEPASKK